MFVGQPIEGAAQPHFKIGDYDMHFRQMDGVVFFVVHFVSVMLIVLREAFVRELPVGSDGDTRSHILLPKVLNGLAAVRL